MKIWEKTDNKSSGEKCCMNKETIANRISKIHRELKNQQIDCILLTKPANVTYTTGFMGDDSWAMITKNQVYLLTDSRYTEQAQKECPSCKIIERDISLSKEAGSLLKKLKSVKSVTVEKSTSLAAFEQLKKNIKIKLNSAADVIEPIRSIKDKSEIAAIKKAASISARALQETLKFIKPGITESELTGMLNFQIRKSGADVAFETIIAFGPNASRPHHQPGRRKLKKTDTVLIDFGAKYQGYCSDITRCFIVGRPTKFYREVYDVVKKAQAAAIKLIKDGADMIKVDAAARDVIEENGLPVYGHGSGHGFGLEIHENPFLKPDGKGTLKAGQVMTIEPGIYLPGKLGARIEDDVLITKKGCEILTGKCPHSPQLP
jgi:Xaa-Pro aminopeptidase